MTEPTRDDPERDAWLRAALVHAPDAEVGAPAALSAAILRAAAERGAPPAPSAWQRLLEAWAWLARPPVAAGFASVMVATVVGLMWWDRPMDEAMPRPPAPATAEVSVAATAPKLEAAPATAPAQPPQPAPGGAAESKEGETPSPMLRGDVPPAMKLRKATEPPLTRQVAASPGAPGAPAVPAPAPETAARRMDDESARERRVAAPPVAEATAPLADRAPAAAPAAPAAMAAAPPPSVPPETNAATRPAAKATGAARAEFAARAAASPPAALLARWKDEAADAHWQAPDASAPQPGGAEARAWLQRLEQATRGRWSPAPVQASTAPAARWWQGDAALGAVHFEADGLRWIGADGRAAFAPLDAATLAALRAF